MKAYEAINWYEKDIDEVFDYLYEQLEEKEQYPFFSWLMEHFPDLDMDWLEIFEDFKEELFQNERIEEVLSFVDWYKQKYADEYIERYEYIEKGLCDYFFYKNDLKRLEERIAFIQQHPISGIDRITIRLLYQLIYHGHYDRALSYAEAVWKPINESDRLIGFAAYPFVNTIYVSKLQDAYEGYLKGIDFDEHILSSQLVSLGLDEDTVVFSEVMLALREDFSKERIEASIKKGEYDHLINLNIHFLKYMLHTYNLPFIFSEWIWDFIANKKLFGKQKGIENWFYLDAKTLDKHILDRYDTFLGSNELEIFVKVWGLDFVFDFLHQKQLLSSSQYEEMLEKVTHFRNEMIRLVNDGLWQMMFVFEWPKIHNFVIDPSERQLFNRTYGKPHMEVNEMVDKFLSMNQIPVRIQKELNKDSKENNAKSIWSKNEPIVREEPKVGRNDLCPCGSGKKFKKCCMDK